MTPKPTIYCHLEVSFICPCKESHGEREFIETGGTLTKPESLLSGEFDLSDFNPRKVAQCSECGRKWHIVDDRRKIKLEIVDWYVPLSVIREELEDKASLLMRLRVNAGLSVEALAREMGVTKPTITSYEKGRVRQPQQAVIDAYAKQFNMSRDEILKVVLWRTRK